MWNQKRSGSQNSIHLAISKFISTTLTQHGGCKGSSALESFSACAFCCLIHAVRLTGEWGKILPYKVDHRGPHHEGLTNSMRVIQSPDIFPSLPSYLNPAKEVMNSSISSLPEGLSLTILRSMKAPMALFSLVSSQGWKQWLTALVKCDCRCKWKIYFLSQTRIEKIVLHSSRDIHNAVGIISETANSKTFVYHFKSEIKVNW